MPQTQKQKKRHKDKAKAKRPKAVSYRPDQFVAVPRGRAKNSAQNQFPRDRNSRYR